MQLLGITGTFSLFCFLYYYKTNFERGKRLGTEGLFFVKFLANLALFLCVNNPSISAQEITTDLDAKIAQQSSSAPAIIGNICINNPSADFNVGSVCVGVPTIFNDNSISISDPIVSWQWNFGNEVSSTLQNPKQTFSTSTSVNVQLIVSTAHCSDTITKTITPHLPPSLLNNDDTECSPFTIEFQSPDELNVNYSWDFGDGSSSIDSKPFHTFINNGNIPITYTIKNRAKSVFGCSDTMVSSVTIYPKSLPLFSISANSICSNTSVTFTNNSQNAVFYKWDFKDGTAVSTQTSPSHNFINNTTATKYLGVELISSSNDGCVDTTINFINVYSLPEAKFSVDKTTFCGPYTVHLAATSGAKTYFWNYGDGISEFGSENMTHLFSNSTENDVVYTITLTVTSFENCINTFQKNVTVHPDTKALFAIDKNYGCSPLTVTISDQSTHALTYSWNIGDGTTSNTAVSFNHLYTNNTTSQITRTIYVTVTSKNGCISSYNLPVNIYPEVVAKYTSNKTIGCTPLDVSFTNQSTNAQLYSWDFGDNNSTINKNPTHTFINSTNAPISNQVTLIAKSSYGCSDTANSTIITVNDIPDALFITDKSTGCSPVQTTITNQTVNGSTFQWSFGDGTIGNSSATTFTHSFVNNSSAQLTRTITVTATSTLGCSSVYNVPFTIFPKVTANFSPDKTSGCGSVDVAFTNQSTNSQIYLWKFGDNTTTNDINTTHTYVNSSNAPITFLVTLTAKSSYGCSDTAGPVNITVNNNSSTNFSFNKSTGCSPFLATITNQILNGSKYQWNFGDGTSGNNANPSFIHQFVNTATAQQTITVSVTATSSQGCVSYYSLPINVFPKVTAKFNPDKTIGCTPFDVAFTNQSTNAQLYTWDFGDNTISNDINPTHIYINQTTSPKINLVSLIAKSSYGCVDTAGPVTITSDFIPIALFLPNKTIGCSPLTINFTNQSVNAATYSWDFGDGTTSTSSSVSVTHSFTNASMSQVSYSVTLKVTSLNGCIIQYSQIVNVFPLLVAQFTHNAIVGCSPVDVTFTNQSQNANAYKWDFGDGYSSTDINPFHTYLNATAASKIFNVKLIAYISTFGCSDTAGPIPITVTNKPTALFHTNKSTGCSPVSVSITNQTVNATSYLWDFGDGTSSTSSLAIVNHNYTNTTTATLTYILKLTATNAQGCTHEFSQSITVFPSITAQFTANKISGCSPLEVQFMNQTLNANSFKWDFDDGTISSNTNVTHIYINSSNTINDRYVTLIAKSSYGCTDTLSTIKISIAPRINAAFAVDKAFGCSPMAITFTNKTSNATSYFWSFDDGSTVSSNKDETHSFSNKTTNNKIFNIVLTANNSYNCPDTSMQSILIYPEVSVSIIPDTAGCSPLIVHFRTNSKNAVNFNWDFGDGQVSNIKNPINIFTNTTISDLALTTQVQATSTMGCKATDMATILLYTTPNSDFLVNATYFELPQKTVQISNNTIGSWQTSWDFGDGKTSSVVNPVSHEFADTGTFKIVLTEQSIHCKDTMSKTISVQYALVKADYDSSFAGCVPLTVTFVNKSRNATSYAWDFGDGAQSVDSVPSHIYDKPGTFVVELTAMNGNRKDVNRNHIITVYDHPKVDFEVLPSIVYMPDADVRCYNKSKNAQKWLWTFGDDFTATVSEPNHHYNDTGTYNVSLIGWDVHGCSDSLYLPKAVTVLKECTIIFPSAFTPVGNETGGRYDPDIPERTNDIFHPIARNIESYHLEIYNRWGEVIFASDDIAVGWDGYYKKALVKQDIYVWKVEATCIAGKKIKQKGNITLLR